ncbi:MAG: DoxX family protein [Rhodospirillales bacterium]|nr:DoxX family protein [Rhodospirillales bacterium]
MNSEQSPPRLVVPALGGLYEPLAPLAWPLVRFMAGLFLMPHGARKLFGWFGGGGLDGTAGFFAKVGLEPAMPLAALVGATEFFGGALIAIGLLTRPAAAAAFILLAVATFRIHMPNGFFITSGGYEYAMLWGFLMLAIVFRGGGALSLDARIGREF